MSGKINVSIGTEKPFKVGAIQDLFTINFVEETIQTATARVESGVSETPKTIDETTNGAINRSIRALQANPNAHFGVGLEGGICSEGDEKYYAVEVAAISLSLSPEKYITETGVSDMAEVPKEIWEHVHTDGISFLEATQKYLLAKGISVTLPDIQKNGTAFYISNGLISREQIMRNALKNAMSNLDKTLGAGS